jgi:hypothetical protein
MSSLRPAALAGQLQPELAQHAERAERRSGALNATGRCHKCKLLAQPRATRHTPRVKKRVYSTIVCLLLAACGSRTGLLGDNGPDPADAALDGPVDAPFDARRDAQPDARDASDAKPEAEPDALPPLDVRPPIDVVRPIECPSADVTFIYVVGSNNQLFSFNPATSAFKLVGTLVCPAGGATPFSMAVDRKGIAYVVYTDGRIYRVSTLTAACVATPFQANQAGFGTFGMGFVSNDNDPGETLFISGSGNPGGNEALGSVNVTNFQVTRIGTLAPAVARMELTGTGDGRLFGYSPDNAAPYIAQLDKRTAALTSRNAVQAGDTNDAFAFAFWGGKFYVFTAGGLGGPTTVTEYNPATQRSATVTTLPGIAVVGAGVSTCAPSQ